MSRFTSFSSYDTTQLYQIKTSGLCPKCNQVMEIIINKPIKGRQDNLNMIYGIGCDDSRCGGCPIDLDTKYYKCSGCDLDFCKRHVEDPNYQGPTNDEKNNTKLSLEKCHDEIYRKETLEILMKRAETEPDIANILKSQIDN